MVPYFGFIITINCSASLTIDLEDSLKYHVQRTRRQNSANKYAKMVAQESMSGSASLNNFIPLLETKGNDDGETTHNEQEKRKTASSKVQLPQELEEELARITKEFTVDTAKLKEIVTQFGEELDEGLKKTHQNIVRATGPPRRGKVDD